MFAFNRKFHSADAIRVPLKVTPLWAGLYLLLTVVIALTPSLQILAIAAFIQAVQATLAIAGGMAPLLIPALTMFSLMLLQLLLTPLRQFIHLRLQMKLRGTLRVAYLEKLNRLEYVHIESPAVWDIIGRLTLNFQKNNVYMEEKFSEMFEQSGRLLQIIINVFSVVAVLSLQIWWLGLVMVVIAVPMLFLSYRLGERSYDNSQSWKKYSRASGNMGEVLLHRQYTAERFLFNFSPQVNAKWAQNYAFIRRQMIRLAVKKTSIIKLGGIGSALMAIILILLMAYLVTRGSFGVATFIPLVPALFNLSNTLSRDLSSSLHSLAETQRFFVDLTKFSLLSELNMTESADDLDPGAFRTLEFHNVRFRYPGTEQYVLNGVNLTIEQGRHYAFVGANGAGKTTITKLIMGLYTDYEGEILLNGIELRAIPPARRRQMFAAVFQDFARYEIPFADNIRLGKPDATEAELAEVIRLIGLSDVVDRLPGGIHTPLGKLKQGGMELSGGEWQRIAMARAALSPAQLKILDEPTAALDPISESRVYEQFDRIIKDATTLFISHRLGSTQLADVIFVLENGKVTEAGSHDELMANRASYHAMYDSQRSWYI
ncbi:ABC transporter ATP-binding protein [Paenibacillus sp. MBLB4367]|uniref:ABC transporter ATP-binding protein n=1 Tax=Paenibacillus sp. MBLB4367 TaxID=3384767 RepID=UPI00390824BF